MTKTIEIIKNIISKEFICSYKGVCIPYIGITGVLYFFTKSDTILIFSCSLLIFFCTSNNK